MVRDGADNPPYAEPDPFDHCALANLIGAPSRRSSKPSSASDCRKSSTARAARSYPSRPGASGQRPKTVRATSRARKGSPTARYDRRGGRAMREAASHLHVPHFGD